MTDEIRSAVLRIYGSRCISQLTNRWLQFCVPMMFITMWNDTFLPTAMLAFATYTSHFFILPYCGAMLDVAHRRSAASILITMKSLCNAGALLALYFVSYLFEMKETVDPEFTKGYVGFAICCILMIVGEAAEESWTLSLEKNWVVLLVENDEKKMTEINVTIRRIDLGCLTVAPLSFGLLLQALQDPSRQIEAGTLIMGLLFVLSWIPEMRLVQSAYDACTLLQHKDDEVIHTSAKALVKANSNIFAVLLGSWSKYTSHRVFGASFAYAMIYFTVLDGGSVMLSFLKWSGVSETVIGLSRGVGAGMGLAGSALFVPVKRHFGESLERTGIFSIWGFWLTLVPVGIAAAAAAGDNSTGGGNRIFGYTLVTCVAAARLWLWLFDLDHTLIMQVYPGDGERAELNGAQSALYRVFWLLLSIVCLIVSDPSKFRSLVFLSLAVVGSASLIFTVWALRVRVSPSSCGPSPPPTDETTANIPAIPLELTDSPRHEQVNFELAP